MQSLALAFALVMAAFAEMAKIGAVLPVLALAIRPEMRPPAPLRQLIDALGGGEPLVVASALLILAALVSVGTRLVLVWTTHRFVVGLGQDIAEQIFARMLRQPYEAYKSRSSSELVTGLEKVRTVIFYVLLPAMQALTAAVVGFTIMLALLAIDAVTASIAAASMGGIFLIARLITKRRLDQNSETIATAAATKMIAVQEALGNIRDILIDQTQPVFEKNFREIDARLRKAQSINMLIAAGPRAFIEAAVIIALVAAALWSSGKPGGIVGALPALGALALGAQRLLPLLQQIYVGWAHVAGNLQSVRDVIDLMRLPMGSSVDRLSSDPDLDMGDIALADVSFSFAGARAGPVLRGVDLHIPKGARVGIVGESGSGKSTLVDLIMGLLTPTSGAISIGGKPMDDRMREQWQRQIAHVPQSVYLSDASISSNIAFGYPPETIDHERVVAAAQAAQASRFIEKLPLSYAMTVGEGGARLSGGERQRIGIARALYKHAGVLILDEAASALDEETEGALLRSLEERNVTLIIVSHRKSSLTGCDFIVEVADGRVRPAPTETEPGPCVSSTARPN